MQRIKNALKSDIGILIKERYGMPKKWFQKTKPFEFEGYILSGLEDYDDYLRFSFGNYMELPPMEKRVQHAPVSDYDFGGV